MSTRVSPTVVALLPSTPQRLWRWPAVLNFFLGGLGAGFYLVSAVAGTSGIAAGAWIGPALVLLGFASVAAEAARPLRGWRVLLRARTSWMSREVWLGGAFAVLATLDALFPGHVYRIAAAIAALLLSAAQGFIVRRARAVAAWSVPLMPGLFVLSALASGSGLVLVVAAIARHATSPWLLGGVLLVEIGTAVVWMRHLTWSREPAFVEAMAPLRRRPELDAVVGGGQVAPMLLVVVAAAMPAVAPAALMAAGTLLMAAQLHWKARLILSAGAVRPVTLAGVRVGARRAAGTSPSGTGGAAWPGPRVRPPACIRPVGTDRRRA